jgi:AcrR family transcriptional regulator
MSSSSPDTAAVDEEQLRAADGRLPGRRGRQTRDKLLDATAEMLETRSYRDLSVVEIARSVGTSPATFYQYFGDVEAAILVLAQRMVEEGAALHAAVAESRWTGRAARDSAEELVDHFLAFWRAHQAVLRVVDLAIAEGDQRFRTIRNEFLGPVTAALRDAAAELGRTDYDPAAAGAVLVSMLAHVAEHQSGLAQWGAGLPGVRDAMIGVVHWVLTGRKPPTE